MGTSNAQSPDLKSTIASPCVLVCNIDNRTGLCLGCARTLDEIARWSRLSDAHKLQILELLPARHRQLQAEDI